MSSFFKKTACVTGIILLGLFGLIGFYSTTLPDFYLVSKGSELSVNSFFTISSKPCESKVTVAVSGGSSGASRYTKNMLMLFGAVPVKEVESKTMERPMLYPCGQPFGIKLLTEGVMVVDLQKVDSSSPAKDCGIREGDVIVSIDGEKVKSNADVAKIISDADHWTKEDTAKFAKAAADCVIIDKAVTATEANGEYTINVPNAGYYLVVDATENNGVDKANSALIHTPPRRVL